MREKQDELKEKFLIESNIVKKRIKISDETEINMLNNIHTAIEKRSRIMRISKKKTVLFVAAAVMAFGAITAVGAGKIAGLYSSLSLKEAQYQNAAEVRKETRLGTSPKAVDVFSNGIRLKKGYFMPVEARDESGTTVGTYPSITLDYEKELFLNIDKPLPELQEAGFGLESVIAEEAPAEEPKVRAGEEKASSNVILTKEEKGIRFTVKADDYLFLPPDQDPSEEARKLEAAGELSISYGSEEEEQKTFFFVSWEEDGLQYLLNTFSTDFTPEELLQMAEEIAFSE